MKQYFLGREEVYTASPRIWSFQKVEENVNGILLRVTNMAGGYHFECNGIKWADSERLYLCGEYSNNTEEHHAIQKELCSAKSGYAAKRFYKSKHKGQVRAASLSSACSGCSFAFGKNARATLNSAICY